MLPTIRPRGFSRFPLVWLAVYLAIGIVCDRYLESAPRLAAAIVPAIVLLTFLKRSSAYFVVPLIFIPLGIICSHIETKGVAVHRIRQIYSEGRIDSGEPVEVEGVLLGLPEAAHNGLFLRLRVERVAFGSGQYNASGKVRLFAVVGDEVSARRYDQLDLRYGSRIIVTCRLEREERFLNPGVVSRTAMLDEQGIDATGTIKSALLIEKIADESVFLPLAWIFEQRQSLIAKFREMFAAPTAGVMIASLLGDKHFLDRETAEVFRDGGTFHVLVISGLHITFIGGLTLWAVSFFTRRGVWQLVLAGGFLWAYTLAVGSEVPVVRATVMFSFLLLSRVIYRHASLMNSFGASIVVLLVWRPADLFSASFQLTVVSVAAIVACAFPLIEKLRAIGSWTPTTVHPFPPVCPRVLKVFCEILYWNGTAWRIENSRHMWSANLFKSPHLKLIRAPNIQKAAAYVFEGLIVSTIVQIWMLPLLVIYFHRVTPLSVFLNLWVGVLLALESFAAIIAVCLRELSNWLAAPLIVTAEYLNSAMLFVPTVFSDASLAGIRIPIYSGFGGAFYWLYGVVVVTAAAGLFSWDPFGLRVFLREKLITVMAIVLSLTLGCLIILHPYSSPVADGRLKIDFLDVGQGDSALVTFPDGRTMLVDGGGNLVYRDESDDFVPDLPRIGESVVSEFLWEKGYSRVDYIVATHSDADHLQGLIDVARNFDIGSVLVSEITFGDPVASEFLTIAHARGIPVSTIGRGDELFIGDAIVEVLHPAADNRGSTNDASIVLRIVFGERAFLLTGDIETAAETELAGDRHSIAADVIKVAHHGSRTSSTLRFIDAARPEIAIISVGRRSPYGHPHREVVARWTEAGAFILKTGDKGTITVQTDGNDLRVRTFIP